MAPVLRTFCDSTAASRALAEFVAEHLAQAIEERGAASLVVSGGRSPIAFFYELSRLDLRWSAVTVTLADERCVPSDHPDSNERLVRTHLLTWLAQAARFVPLRPGAVAPAMDKPFDVVVLGMGEDGHTASLFPDSPQLDSLLDAHAPRAVACVERASAKQSRLTLTARALTHARAIAILIGGPVKRIVYERALAPGPARELPIRVALHQSSVPCHVFWNP